MASWSNWQMCVCSQSCLWTGLLIAILGADRLVNMGALLCGLAMLVVPGGCHVRRDLKIFYANKRKPTWSCISRRKLESTPWTTCPWTPSPEIFLSNIESFSLSPDTFCTSDTQLLSPENKSKYDFFIVIVIFKNLRISSSKSMYLFLIKSVIWSMHTPWSALLWGPFIQGPDTDVVAVVVEGQGLSTNLRVCPHLLHYLPALFCAVFWNLWKMQANVIIRVLHLWTLMMVMMVKSHGKALWVERHTSEHLMLATS